MTTVASPRAELARLTARETADLFGVHLRTLEKWVAAGKLTVIRTPGGHRRFLPSEVEALRSAQAAERAEAGDDGFGHHDADDALKDARREDDLR
jgi:excisionase family DNA binding protein